jgi:WD40 repeat protein
MSSLSPSSTRLPAAHEPEEQWDERAAALCDLTFVEARCAAGKLDELQADYAAALEGLPEARPQIEQQAARRAEMARFLEAVVGSQGRGPLPPPPAVVPWSDEQTWAECDRLCRQPTRLDRVRLFADFVAAESHRLRLHGRLPGFCLQQALNYADAGPVVEAAEAIVRHRGDLPLIRRHRRQRPPFNPRPARLRRLDGHKGGASAAALTPDGRLGLTGGRDGSVCVWDVSMSTKGQQAGGLYLHTLTGHTAAVAGLAVTPDGRTALSGGEEGSLRAWDTSTGDCLQRVALAFPPRHVGLTVDGRLAMAACQGQPPEVWDLTTGRRVAVFGQPLLSAGAAALLPDGRAVIVANAGHDLEVLGLDEPGCLLTLAGHTGTVRGLWVSLDGRRVVSAGDDRTVRVWDLETGRCLRVLSGSTGGIRFARPTADGRLVVAGTGKATVRIWDVDTGRRLRNVVNGPRTGTDLGQTPDGKLLVLDGATLWDLATGQTDLIPSELAEEDVTDNPLLGLRAARKSEVVLAARVNASGIWDLGSGSRLRKLEAGKLTAACLTADGRMVVSATEEGTLRAWGVPGGACLWAEEGHAGTISALAVTADGRTGVSAGVDRTLRVWDLADGGCLRVLGGSPAGVTQLALSPDGRTAVMAEGAGDLHAWDLAVGTIRRRLDGHTGPVSRVVVAADGRVAVSASRDGTLRVWDLAAGTCRLSLQGHTGEVLDVCVSPDGRTAVSAGTDGGVRVWDLATGGCRHVLQHPGAVEAVRVTPDGGAVVSFCGADTPDGTVGAWELVTARCLAVLPAGRDLEGVSEIRQDGRFAFSQKGAVKPALLAGARPAVPWATAVRRPLWDEPDSGDGECVACCPHCGGETAPAGEVLDAIRRIVSGLSPGQAPVLDLPPEAWDAPELRGTCTNCGGPLRFNPFVVGAELAQPAVSPPAPAPAAVPLAGPLRQAVEGNEALRRHLAADPAAMRLVLALTADPQRERTSALVPLVTEALLRGESAAGLAALLRDACHTSDNPLSQGEALLGLAALGFDVTPILETARSEPELQEGARAAEALLVDLARSLGEQMSAVWESMTSLLRTTLPECTPALAEQVARSALGVLMAYGARDYNHIEVWGEVPELQASLAAEFWSLLTRTGGRARQGGAATLETAGQDLGGSPLLLAETLARAAGARQRLAEHGEAWPLDELPPRPSATADLLAEALDALVALPQGLEPIHAWALARLAPLLAETDLTAEALVDAVATLPDRSAALAGAVAALLPGAGAALLADPDPRAALLTLARSLPEPWPRFRAMRRLLVSFRSARPELLPEALEAAREIAEPVRRSRSLEQLVFLAPAAQRPPLLGQALAAARSITDPDDRARALGRLSAHFPPALTARPLREALGVIATVADPGHRAELLELFGPLLLPHPELRRQARELIDHLGDDTAQARALGWLSPPLLLRQETLARAVPERPETAATLILAALVHDALQRSGRPLTAAGLWEALADGHETARAALEQRGEAGGLSLSRAAAGALERLLATGADETNSRAAVEAARTLLRLVQKPGPNVVPYLHRWRTHPDAGIRQQANLLLAEAEGLSDQTLPGLLGLATAADDRSRHRAALATHGGRLAWAFATRVSRVDTDTLNLLGRAWLRYRDRDPHLALLLFRTWQYLLHDDPAAIATLAAAVKAGGRDAEVAEVNLRMIGGVTPAVWGALLLALRDGDGRTQRAVLEAVFALAGNGRLPEGGAEQLAAVVPRLDRAALADWRILAGGPRVVVQSAALLLGVNRGDGQQRVAAAMGAAVRDRSVPVAGVLSQPPAVLLPALTALGLVPYRTQGYEEQVRAAGQVVGGNPGLVLILAQRLLRLLTESFVDASLLYPERRDLLNVLAAVAGQSRGLLAPAVGLDGWESLLAGAAARSFFRAARVSAVRLLGCGGRLSRTVAEGVRVALRDTPEAQAAAQQLAAEVGSVEDAGLDVVTGALVDDCPTVAWNAAVVLSILARNPCLTNEQCGAVGKTLARAAADPRASRAVYGLEETLLPDGGQTLALRYLGRLEQVFRQHLALLSAASGAARPNAGEAS